MADDAYAELIRKGLITLATKIGKPLPPPTPPIMTLDELLKDLDEARADRDLPGGPIAAGRSID